MDLRAVAKQLTAAQALPSEAGITPGVQGLYALLTGQVRGCGRAGPACAADWAAAGMQGRRLLAQQQTPPWPACPSSEFIKQPFWHAISSCTHIAWLM